MIPLPSLSLVTWLKLGAAVILALAIALLVHQRDHWKGVAADRQTQIVQTQAAFDQTVANYRAAAAQASAADAANAARVAAEQSKISQESSDEYEARIADARAAAAKLRSQLAAAANPGGRPTAPVSGVPAAASGPAQSPAQDGFSVADRLTATEQAIQLDELIKWVKKQAGVDTNGKP